MYDADEHASATGTPVNDPNDISRELDFIQYLASTSSLSEADGKRLAAAGQKIQSVLSQFRRTNEKYRRAWLLNMRDGSTVYWKDPLRVESGYYALDLTNSDWTCHHDTLSNTEDMEFVITAPFDPEFEQTVSAEELFPDAD